MKNKVKKTESFAEQEVAEQEVAPKKRAYKKRKKATVVEKEYPKISRTEEQKKILNHRINRAVGILGGVKRMIENDRVSEDILMQISATQSVLNSIRFDIFKEVMTGDAEKLKEADESTIDQILTIIRTY